MGARSSIWWVLFCHLLEIWNTLTNATVLHDVGFLAYESAAPEELSAIVFADQSCAHTHGIGLLALLNQRLLPEEGVSGVGSLPDVEFRCI